MAQMGYRQIHLDFHTSPYIPDVGKEFDPREFVDTLKKAHVESVTCFAKCHHGMCYYPTKVGTMHPGLSFDLLGEMIKACHKEGIKVPIYIAVGWEEDAAWKHPEWQQVNMEGILGGKTPFENKGWKNLCLNNSVYLEHVLTLTDEILSLYDADGFFYDIIQQDGCVCNTCISDMKALGLTPDNEDDVKQHDFIAVGRFMKTVTDFIRSKKADAGIYYNTEYNISIGYRKDYCRMDYAKYNTHIEIESLPSGPWGYNHFPRIANAHNYRPYGLVGMTGKFHKGWGDFGSLKNTAALEYECFRMLANGTKCSIGDQLHPRGRLDKAVYSRIGNVYESIKEKEKWCREAIKIVEIAVITPVQELSEKTETSQALEGAVRILLELKQPFDIIDWRTPLDKYKLVILPDFVRLDDALAGRLKDFMESGGKLLVSNQSGLKTDENAFALESFGVEYIGEAPYAPDYVRFEDCFGEGIEPVDYCFYERGSEISAARECEVLALTRSPYFNRSWDKFCSHLHTPPDKLTDSPAVVKNGNIIYISKPVFKDYSLSGTKVYKDMVKKCMDMLMPDILLKANLLSSAEVTLYKQDLRYVLHVLSYIPQKKCMEMEIVEDIIPLYNSDIQIRMEKCPSRIYIAAKNTDLKYDYRHGYASFTIPCIEGHIIIVIE